MPPRPTHFCPPRPHPPPQPHPQTPNACPPTPTHGAFFAIAEAPNPNAALRYPIDAPKRGATETPNLSSDASSLNDAPFRCVVPPPNLIAVAFLIIGAAQPMSVAIARTASRTSAPSTAPRPTCAQTKSPLAPDRSEEHTSELQSLMRLS